MLSNLKQCPQCGQIYMGEVCENCSKRYARINNCLIVEAEGRCQEYLDGKCKDCLDFCAQNDWIGWRKLNGSTDE